LLAIIISGMSAVGKSTVARVLAREYGLKYYCGGDALKELASKRSFEPKGDDWWDTSEGMRFLEERRLNPEFDRLIDKQLADTVKKGDVVISSYPIPWLVKDGVKIWLKASPETRAKRMAGRDKIPYERALEIVKRRDIENAQLYRSLYGINFGEDLSVFDFVIGTDHLSKKAVVEIASIVVRQFK
jgi:cytidylate kinase